MSKNHQALRLRVAELERKNESLTRWQGTYSEFVNGIEKRFRQCHEMHRAVTMRAVAAERQALDELAAARKKIAELEKRIRELEGIETKEDKPFPLEAPSRKIGAIRSRKGSKMPVDMKNKRCACGGHFAETCIYDDWEGPLHCTKCGKEVRRWS